MGPRVIDADVCVVGAGIVGLAHAHEARNRGLRVAVLERDTRAVGASLRNFGHGIVCAMSAGEPLEFALAARERWLELGVRAGFEVSEAGSLIVVDCEDELAVIEALACDERRGAAVVGPEQIAGLAPIPTDGLVGALHARLDIRVDPRRAIAGLAALLQRDREAELVWGAAVQSIEPGRVHSAAATVTAPLVIVCPGPDFAALPAELQPRREGLTRCVLHMLRVAAPEGRRYGPALMTGLSLLRYPGFTSQPGIERVRERLDAQRPDLIAAGIHLIVTQLPGGDLIIGDTHAYGDTVSPFRDERLDRMLLGEAGRLLGVPSLEVRERWLGVYPVAPGYPFLVQRPVPGVMVVEIVSGIGMTTALGLAARVMADATGELRTRPAGRRSPPPAAQPLTGEAHAGYGS